MKKYLILIITVTMMVLTLMGCKKAGTADAGDPGTELSTGFKHYYEMTNWKEADRGYTKAPTLYVTYNASENDLVQIDCGDWISANTFIMVPYPMTSGDYLMGTYSDGGESTDHKVKVEIAENSISITEYSNLGDLADFTYHFKKKK